MSTPYQQALTQIDQIIADVRSRQSAVCSLAEQDDLLLTRLDSLKHTLRPDDDTNIERIRHYHQQHFAQFPHEHD